MLFIPSQDKTIPLVFEAAAPAPCPEEAFDESSKILPLMQYRPRRRSALKGKKERLPAVKKSPAVLSIEAAFRDAELRGESVAQRFEEMLRGSRLHDGRLARYEEDFSTKPWDARDAKAASDCRARAYAEAAAAKAADDLFFQKEDKKKQSPRRLRLSEETTRSYSPRRRQEKKCLLRQMRTALPPISRRPLTPPKIWLQRDHRHKEQRQTNIKDHMRQKHNRDKAQSTDFLETMKAALDVTQDDNNKKPDDSFFLRKQQQLIDKYRGALMPKKRHDGTKNLQEADLYSEDWLASHFDRLLQEPPVPFHHAEKN